MISPSQISLIYQKTKINKIIELRKVYKVTMNLLIDSCEIGRTLSIALTDLESSLMYAIKAIVMESEHY